MIKFTADIPGEDTMLLGLGLCEENLQLLMLNKPIGICGSEVNTPNDDYALIAGKDWAELEVRTKPLIEGVYPDTKDPACERRISIGDVCDGSLYVMPLPRPGFIIARTIHALCLTEKSMRLLRGGTKLSFRFTPFVDGLRQRATQVCIFWMRSQEELENDFVREGLITGQTNWTKDGERQYVMSEGHYRGGRIIH